VTARLISIELEAFRGFADAQRFDLDADVVLVRGDNGSGKTSLIDGLLWLLTGEIPRLSKRARGLRRGHDPLINIYAGAPARVRISLVGWMAARWTSSAVAHPPSTSCWRGPAISRCQRFRTARLCLRRELIRRAL